MKLPKGLHKAAKVRMDYNESHDETGRFSVGAASSSSAIVEAGGPHYTKESADKQAKQNSTKHNGLHTVYDNHAKTYVSSFRAGQEVALKSAKPIPSDRTGTRYGGYVSKQGTKEAGQALRDLQAKNAAAKRDPLADIPSKPVPSAAAKAAGTRLFIAQTSRDMEAKDKYGNPPRAKDSVAAPGQRAGTAKAAEHAALGAAIDQAAKKTFDQRVVKMGLKPEEMDKLKGTLRKMGKLK